MHESLVRQDFTVLIPARMASTRLPNKPLADIAGLPMVVRVAQRAALSKAHRVVVATDAAEVHAVCLAHGIEALMTRTDHVSGSDRLAELERTEDDAAARGQRVARQPTPLENRRRRGRHRHHVIVVIEQ